MRLDTNELIAGAPILEVRRLLRRFNDGIGQLDVEGLLGLNGKAALALLDELSRLGLLKRSKAEGERHWMECRVTNERGWQDPREQASGYAGSPTLKIVSDGTPSRWSSRMTCRLRRRDLP